MKKSDLLFAVLTGLFLGVLISLADWCRFFL